MFGKRIKLFKLLDFEVHVDLSWIVIALLVSWSLSTGVFPFQFRGLSVQMYWTMGIIGAAGLFLSIIVHELAHSVVARRQGMPMHGITLFIFGGVAEMGKEPPRPRAEFLMAAVGPLTSFALAFLFYGTLTTGVLREWPLPVIGVFNYLTVINIILALFNLLPAYPLDGGRVLRSILWGIRGNLEWATRISAGIGIAFGFFIMGYGFMRMFGGDLIGGMWMVLIGMFLQTAARMSHQQLIIRRMLQGKPIERFMQSGALIVPPSATVEQLVKDYIYRHHLKMLPVSDSGKLEGCVFADQVKGIPREQWPSKTVGEIARPCGKESMVDSQADSAEFLTRMGLDGGRTRFIVMEGDTVVGAVSLKDIINSVSLRMELEKEVGRPE